MVQDIRTIGIQALVSFHAVARTGGISSAAEHLGFAKSGVSRHVAQLEAHFGVRLLERGARSVRLTPVGTRFDDRIRSILAELDLLGEIAREESAGITGQVTIAATPEFGGLVAQTLFPVARERHPDLTIVMRPAYSFEDMQDPNTDLAFRIGTFKDDRLVARTLGGFRRRLVGTPGFLAKHPVTRPEDLAHTPCLTFRNDRPGATWTFRSKKGEESAVDVTGPIAVHSFSTLFDLALAGQGLSLLPSFMLTEALRMGTLVECLPDHRTPSHPVFLTFRPGASRVARIGAMIKLAEELLPAFLSA
ncbi:MAG: LysR family transcriptional regulator [Pseudomonadota bacterium]